jgi:hypothetical protein
VIGLLARGHGVAERPDPLDLDLELVAGRSATGGERKAPTPAGVPVSSRSPGSSVKAVEACATSSRTPKMRSLVRESWSGSPFSRWTMRRSPASPSSATETSAGPSGQKVSNDFARSHWTSRCWRSRADVVRAGVGDDRVQRVVGGDPADASADHDRELGLGVDVAALRRQHDRLSGPVQRVRELGEQQRFLREVDALLLGRGRGS